MDAWDSIWCSIVSQSTVGYGDYTPHTHLGRTVLTIDIITGIILLSLVMMKSQASVCFSKQESALYRLVCYTEGKQKYLRGYSAIVIQRWWRVLLARREKSSRLGVVTQFRRQLYQYKFRLRTIEALKNSTLEEDLRQFQAGVESKVKKTTHDLQEFSKFEKRAFILLNTEFSNFNKAKNVLAWCKSRLRSFFPCENSPTAIAPESARLHRGSASSQSTFVLKLKRQQARDSALKKLKKRLAKELDAKAGGAWLPSLQDSSPSYQIGEASTGTVQTMNNQ